MHDPKTAVAAYGARWKQSSGQFHQEKGRKTIFLLWLLSASNDANDRLNHFMFYSAVVFLFTVMKIPLVGLIFRCVALQHYCLVHKS